MAGSFGGAEVRTDLLGLKFTCMATHGRKGRLHLVFGSVSEKMIRGSSVSGPDGDSEAEAQSNFSEAEAHQADPEVSASTHDSGGLPADRVVAGGGKEGLQQHSPQTKLLRLAKQIDADRHSVVTGFRLGQISSQQPVPPREIETKVAVRFVD